MELSVPMPRPPRPCRWLPPSTLANSARTAMKTSRWSSERWNGWQVLLSNEETPWHSLRPTESRLNSHHSVDQTVDRLTSILQARGVALFALVDHSGEAEKAGMQMRPTKLLIFGSPKAGTPVMLPLPA